ncbi:zinc finger CCCH domain-containing protein 10-like [Planococcus citri]|uniref:zinc finger CCCH domain-containing protein 10-like n=1 Tax=Planococcus citri TaxID=170843 RepID=UPI0031F9FD3A
MLIINMSECEATCRRCELQNDKATEKLIICRDFLRNLCKRGEQCKYFHPQRDEGKEVYVFCHDFQNGGCARLGCRFIHCSAEDEDYYNKTGELLPHVYDAYRKIIESLDESGPVCKDYFKGKCKRESCKFRHLPEERLCENEKPKPVAVKSNNRKPDDRCCQISFEPKHYRNEYEDYGCECKRRRMYNHSPDLSLRNCENTDNRKLWVLESENEMLRQRLSELTKKNSDLQATNEFLLEQNARLRMGEKNTPSLTAVTVPAVTITNTGTLPQGQVNMQQPQVLRTVAASVATVPVSLAAVAATPVSLAAVSVAPMQIPPVCTVAHTANGTTIQQETPQLVSYPILNRPTIIQSALQHH